MACNVLVDYETEERLVPLLADLLERILQGNEAVSALQQDHIPAALVSFYACRESDVSVSFYLDRIYHLSECSPACLIVAMVYLERVLAKQLPAVVHLTRQNVHRIVVTAVLLATKFLEDLHYDNLYWSKIAGIPLKELNKLESQFLALLDWRLDVSEELFGQYFWALLGTSLAPAASTGTVPQDTEEEEFFDASNEAPAAIRQVSRVQPEQRLSPTRRSYSEDVAKTLASFQVSCY